MLPVVPPAVVPSTEIDARNVKLTLTEDLPLVEWSCRTLLYRTQEQLHGLLRNFPNRAVAAILRFFIFPRGRTYFAPSDDLGQEIVELIINPTPTREAFAD